MKNKRMRKGSAALGLGLGLLFSLAAHAGGGGFEWGNGEGGFSNELPKLELPFQKPLEISETHCRLFFDDGNPTPAMERIKKTDQGWCVSGVVEEWGFRKPTKRTEWACALDTQKMFQLAIEKHKLGLRCEVQRRTFARVVDFLEAYPVPVVGTRHCRSFLLSNESLPLEYRIPERRSRMWMASIPDSASTWLRDLLDKAQASSAELVLRTGISEYAQKDMAQWLGKEMEGKQTLGRPYMVGTPLFQLNEAGSSPLIHFAFPEVRIGRTDLTCDSDPGLTSFGESIPVGLSVLDQQAVAVMEQAVQRLPLSSLLNFASIAEMLHYRARNQETVAQIKSWYEGLRQAALRAGSHLDPRYNLLWSVARSLEGIEEVLQGFYANPVWYGGECRSAEPNSSLKERLFYSRDCRIMDQSVIKIQDRVQRLRFAYPKAVAPYDPAGCRYVVDMAATLQDLHNRFFIFDDYPIEFYGTAYSKKVLEVMKALSELQYRRESPGEFLESVLPRWREVCRTERPQIESILAGFRKQ